MRALGPVVLLDSLTAEQLGDPPTYFNARYLLTAAAASPIPATKTLGNLTRSFVERAFAEMRWPAESAEIIRFINKTLDEPDVPRLRLLRAALQNGRMLRKYRGAFHATTRGRALLTPGREGELYLALFEAYFQRTNLAFTDGYPADPWLQHGVPQLLWLLQSTGGMVTIGDLAAGMIIDTAAWPDREYCSGFELLTTALRRRILEPLEEFGLVEVASPTGERPWRAEPQRQVRVTQLFGRFVIPAASLN